MTQLIGPESLLVSLVLLLAVTFPQFGASWFAWIERNFGALARRKKISVLICGIAALAFRAAILPVLPVPLPFIQDEFSYLLAADTFAHGRLTNPTPPMWEHFEAIHVISQPTYASKYPVMQGLILAAGKVIGGHPFVGVWLSVGIMCAAICWMLQAWLPPQWALLGGLLAVMRIAAFSYWSNSYWGGAAAAIGGALVLGALPRIMRRQRVRDSIVMALGLGILANSRPFEGLMLALPVGVALLIWIFRKRRGQFRPFAFRIVLPIVVVLAVVGAGMGYYFWRVTGSPVQMPYQVNQHQYPVAPYFIWQRSSPAPTFRHKILEGYYLGAVQRHYLQMRTPLGFLQETALRVLKIWAFYLAPALTIPLFTLPWIVRDRRIRWLIIIGAISFAGSLAATFFDLHYIAALTCMILAIVLTGIRHLRVWRWEGRPVGLFLARATVLVCVLVVPVQLVTLTMRARSDAPRLGAQRAAIVSELSSQPGRQLAIVRYRPDHPPLGNEWVNNDADLEHAKVIWARDMGPKENQELTRHYRDRQVWLVEPDETPPKLSPYNTVESLRHTPVGE